ncbi:MAG: DUF2723 domain-containing protein [Candidatus Zixiibacteriota bacterium]
MHVPGAGFERQRGVDLHPRSWFAQTATPSFTAPGLTLSEARKTTEERLTTGWLLATIVFILTLILYVATMCRTVFWWDSGELAANAKVLGIAHRPGFPLFILLGRLFALAPFGDLFYRVNFVSAITASTALAIFTYVWLELVVQILRPRRNWEALIAVVLPVAAIAGTYTLWIQAVRAEVYAPTLLAVALLWGTALGAQTAARSGHGETGRWLCLAGFLAGLGFGLHNATFLSVWPAFLLFFVILSRRYAVGLRTWLAPGLLLLVGVTVYLYLPVRAGQNPPLNWGWTTTALSPGWGTVVAKDAIGGVLTTGVGTLVKRASQAGMILFDQLHWGLVILAAWGIVCWWRRSRSWTLLALGVFAGNLVVTALLVNDPSDTNADVHGYLLPALSCVAFFAVGGLIGLAGALTGLRHRIPTPSLRRILTVSIVGTIGLLAIAPLVINAPYCNLVSHRLAYDFGTEATADLRPGAVVFVAATDLDFVLRGLQYCDGWRQDLRILNRDLLPAAWYRQWVFDSYPELADFPIPHDSVRLNLGLWAANLARAGFPVYWEFTETSMEVLPNLTPAGHLFALSPEPVPYLEPRQIRAQEEFERQSRFYGSPRRILYDYDAQRVYVATLYRAGMYYETRGLYDRARELFQRALSVFRGDSQARKRAAGRALGMADSLTIPLSATPRLDSTASPQ